MDIGILKEVRTKKNNKDLTIPEKELCDRYEKVSTGMVNDVLREKGYLYQTFPNNIMPLRDSMKVCGPVFTIKGSKNLELKDEMIERAKMLEAISKNCVCVWDTSGDDESAQWGEIMTMAAKKQGCRGAIIDGGIRDTDKILEQDFPVFFKYKSSNGMLGRFRISGYQVPVMIGNVTVFPGDFVLGDIDGCILVPRDICVEVLIRAEQIRDGEVGIKSMIQGGSRPTEVVEKGGYF